jgi:uncharacterized membrane protein
MLMGHARPHVRQEPAAGATMFSRQCLLHHGVALGLIAAAIVALVTGLVGWLVFAAWMILTVALYVCGWIYYLMVVRDRAPWDTDLDL